MSININKFRIFLCLAAFSCILLSSCSSNEDEPEYMDFDVSPWCQFISVQNENGDNLIDPDFAGNILDKSIILKVDGEEYTLNPDRRDREFMTITRIYLPHFYGIGLVKDMFDLKDWQIFIGEFERMVPSQTTYKYTVSIPALGVEKDFEATVSDADHGYGVSLTVDGAKVDPTVPYVIVL